MYEHDKTEYAYKRGYEAGVKEFAKRLKEHTTTAIFGQGKYRYEIITEQSIDNLVKEMELGK